MAAHEYLISYSLIIGIIPCISTVSWFLILRFWLPLEIMEAFVNMTTRLLPMKVKEAIMMLWNKREKTVRDIGQKIGSVWNMITNQAWLICEAICLRYHFTLKWRDCNSYTDHLMWMWIPWNERWQYARFFIDLFFFSQNSPPPPRPPSLPGDSFKSY